MPVVALAVGSFIAVCDLSIRAVGAVDEALFGGAVLDSLLGPHEDFEHVSTTTPVEPPTIS